MSRKRIKRTKKKQQKYIGNKNVAKRNQQLLPTLNLLILFSLNFKIKSKTVSNIIKSQIATECSLGFVNSKFELFQYLNIAFFEW